MNRELPVYLVGSGLAARAFRSALALVSTIEPDLLPLSGPHHVKRGEKLPNVKGPALLLIANPHALHADTILQGDQAGFSHIICEKPVAVNPEQVESLRNVSAQVAVLHGYRMMWGPQRLRAAVIAEELGELVSLEGRYWQSSAAAHFVANGMEKHQRDIWKNDVRFSGSFDVMMDLGTHWADLVSFLIGTHPHGARARLSYVNAEAPHRDTHVQLELDFKGGLRTWGSISKTLHGYGNHLEIVLVGSRAAMTWNFERPDELVVGVGSETHVYPRSKDQTVVSGLPPQHALGWLEGYVSIVQQVVRDIIGQPALPVPTLKDSLAVAQMLLDIDIQP